eukprot:CAMPEP_0119123156 /NCGR_PEP_ID=MMETSP1310-20130426/3184_1 /TAXON_ID=464262 /ORGANISM="Genus nov. species nov., Strain RCC2339" /LENGTH=202 /DNA_ID=CAMNT_0007112913 /DNA_START=79 /DNA_END=683 /DNA_ORIENTATION=-
MMEGNEKRTPPTKRIVLGSSSKWRRAVLERMYPGHAFVQLSPDIDEKSIRHDSPGVLPALIADAKMEALLEKFPEQVEDALLIASDQVASYGGVIREKPRDEAEARLFLASYRGSSVQTYSAIAVMNTATGKRRCEVDVATIHVREDLPDAVIDAMIAKGDIFTCCGGFAIEDEGFSKYITHIEGEQSSVEGFPASVVDRLL